MSRDLFFTVKIDTPLNINFITSFVNHGAESGLIYLDHKNIWLAEAYTILTTEQIIQKAQLGIEYISQFTYNDFTFDRSKLPQWAIKKESMVATIVFSRFDGNLTSIMLDPIVLWYWNNDETGDYKYGPVDWERYALLMFALCKRFHIISMKTYDSYYEE